MPLSAPLRKSKGWDMKAHYINKRAARAVSVAFCAVTCIVLFVLGAAIILLMIKAVTVQARAEGPMVPYTWYQDESAVQFVSCDPIASVDPVLCEIQSRYYYLSPRERQLVERVVMAESGGEPYKGQVLVVQCILDGCVKDGLRPAAVIEKYQYCSWRPEPTNSVRKAVSAVFDRGDIGIDAPILYFYAPAHCRSSWHESQIFRIEVGGHRFFEEREL